MPLFNPANIGSVIRTTEVDFGSTPLYEKEFTITDVEIGTATLIGVVLSGEAPTGKSADEVEFDRFEFSAKAAAGSATVRMISLTGPVVGAFKIVYIMG